MLEIFDHWSLLSTFAQICYISLGIGACGTVLFLVAHLLGFDSFFDFDIDFESDLLHISTHSILGFFLGLGILGTFLTDLGLTNIVSIPLSILAGLFTGYLQYKLSSVLKYANNDKHQDLTACLHKVGTVYITIPANMAHGGHIHIYIDNQHHELPAVTTSTKDIAPGTQVIVNLLEGRLCTVSPLDQDGLMEVPSSTDHTFTPSHISSPENNTQLKQ